MLISTIYFVSDKNKKKTEWKRNNIIRLYQLQKLVVSFLKEATETGQLMQMLVDVMCPLCMLIATLCICSLPFNINQIVDFVDNAILSNNITSGNASILNFGTTVAAQA